METNKGIAVDEDKKIFVQSLMLLMEPTIKAELEDLGPSDPTFRTQFVLEVDILLRKLIGRFYDIGQTEATMYMPMVMAYLRRMKQ